MNSWFGFLNYLWSLAFGTSFLFGEIFLKLSLGMVDGVLIRVPDEMFRFWVSIGGGDIGLTIDVNGFDLPVRKIR